MSLITLKMQSGDGEIMMNSSIVRVSPMRVIMEIHSRIKMILTTLFVLKVSWMTMMKKSGGTVMIMSLSIVKVNLIKHIMEILNTLKIGGTKVFLFIC